MSELKDEFASRLRGLRDETGMTQTELAALINSTKIQISRYETAEIIPSVETLLKLANVFNCSADYLLGRTDSPRIGVWREGDFSPDERRIIDAIRMGDVRNTLSVLSMLLGEAEERRMRLLDPMGYGYPSPRTLPARIHKKTRKMP